MKILGIILVLVGLAMMIAGRVRYKTKEKLVDTGGVEITIAKDKMVNWPWYAGGIALVGGTILLLLAGQKRRETRPSGI